MRKTSLLLLLAACLAVAAPVQAQTDLGQALANIAQSLFAQDQDRKAYVQAQSLNTANAYRDYLARYPKGAYRVNADQALVALGVSTDHGYPPPPGGDVRSAAYVEASIGLSRTDRIQIQKQLTAQGYSAGVADGLWGSNTRGAIARWQTANRLTVTGYLTTLQVKLIRQQSGSTASPGTTGNTPGDDLLEERLLNLTYSERREVQIRLSTLGYNTGGADGVFGQNTRRALATWQRDGKSRVTGYLTADQLRALRRQTGG